MTARVLVVDDDPQIRDVLRIALGQAGHEVLESADGLAALEAVRCEGPDLIVLDIGLPEMDGLDVCREVRKTHRTPILFLTARSDEIDKVLGLEMGADDYVSKPFSPRELVARVKAILKRAGPVTEEADGLMRRGVVEVDVGRHICRVRGVQVQLTAREMEILHHLIRRPEQVNSRPQLVDAIYGTNIHVSDRTLDSHLRNLRSKLVEAGCADAIETVHGVGVRMGTCQGA